MMKGKHEAWTTIMIYGGKKLEEACVKVSNSSLNGKQKIKKTAFLQWHSCRTLTNLIVTSISEKEKTLNIHGVSINSSLIKFWIESLTRSLFLQVSLWRSEINEGQIRYDHRPPHKTTHSKKVLCSYINWLMKHKWLRSRPPWTLCRLDILS